MKNTDAMIKTVRDMANEKEKHVLKIIEQMKKNEEKISIYSVSGKADVSRNYLYKNERLFNIINEERNRKLVEREEESTQTIISALKLKISKLEKENAELKKYDYKEKYDKVLKENAELKKQLETAYKY